MMNSGSSSGQTIFPELLVAIWDRLRSGLEGQLHVAEPSGLAEKTLFLLSLGTDGEPAILIGIDAQSRFLHGLGGKNISIGEREISFEGKVHKVLEAVCHEARLQLVFAELVIDVLRRVSSGLAGERALERSLADFRRLLERETGSSISWETAVGLIGELVVLRELVRLHPGAWRAWSGPLDEVHDFRWADASIEVKATAHVGDTRMEVHGLDQLRPTPRGLWLFQIVLAPDPQGSVSVPRLVREVHHAVDEPSSFMRRVAEAGYLEVETESWEDHVFSVSQMACFSVDDAFPKLTENQLSDGKLASGIERVRYCIAVSAIREWKVPEDRMDRVLREFLGDGD